MTATQKKLYSEMDVNEEICSPRPSCGDVRRIIMWIFRATRRFCPGVIYVWLDSLFPQLQPPSYHRHHLRGFSLSVNQETVSVNSVSCFSLPLSGGYLKVTLIRNLWEWNATYILRFITRATLSIIGFITWKWSRLRSPVGLMFMPVWKHYFINVFDAPTLREI